MRIWRRFRGSIESHPVWWAMAFLIFTVFPGIFAWADQLRDPDSPWHIFWTWFGALFPPDWRVLPVIGPTDLLWVSVPIGMLGIGYVVYVTHMLQNSRRSPREGSSPAFPGPAEQPVNDLTCEELRAFRAEVCNAMSSRPANNPMPRETTAYESLREHILGGSDKDFEIVEMVEGNVSIPRGDGSLHTTRQSQGILIRDWIDKELDRRGCAKPSGADSGARDRPESEPEAPER